MRRSWILLGIAVAFTSFPQSASAQSARPWARPCQPRSPERSHHPQGTLLWGTTQLTAAQPMSTVLASVKLEGARTVEGKSLDLSFPSDHEMPRLSPGTVLRGASSTGTRVDVAVCEAKGADGETLYQLEVRTQDSLEWKNPCVPGGQGQTSRALAVRGVWDATGARKENAREFTFACEQGAIAKCAQWGYKPWNAEHVDLHQACTRMARADYCGTGRSHTWNDNVIDLYDSTGVVQRETRESPGFSPARATFESSWSPDGATCLARTRKGEPLQAILDECPKRFVPGAMDFGDGDVCTLVLKGPPVKRGTGAWLNTRSYPPPMKATHP
ncbi:ADYC domain-containing protein [Melittangium boletus]|uniref:ADYC domain-containing protein n=1 Tax=Melittangium boletus TaxID=83453 RepID=UPI003DA3219B